MKIITPDKDDVVKILREKGFDSENMSGVIMTKFPFEKSSDYYKEHAREVKRIMEALGYNASKGFCVVKTDKEKSKNE